MNNYDDYDMVMKSIMAADIPALEEYSQLIEGFPTGKDDFINRHWITNAIDCGGLEVVIWMLSKGVSTVFRDEEGYSVLHSAIESENPEKYDMMRALIKHGADLNVLGINGYASAHMAAVRNDIEALKVLKNAGADFSLRTEIDDYATPYEEAFKYGGNEKTLAWLRANT